MLNRRQQIQRLQGMESRDPRQQRRLETLQDRRQQGIPTQAQMQSGAPMPQQQPMRQPMPMGQPPAQIGGVGGFEGGNLVPYPDNGFGAQPQGMRPTFPMQQQPNFGPGPSMGAYSPMGWQSSGMMPQGMPQQHPGNFRAMDRMQYEAQGQAPMQNHPGNFRAYGRMEAQAAGLPLRGRGRGLLKVNPPAAE